MRFVSILAVLIAVGTTATFPAIGHGNPQGQSGSTAAPHASEFGGPGNAMDARRTVEISLLDTMRITPEHLNVQQGETVRLRIRNSGVVPHEFVLGTQKEIAEHRDMMRTMPTMTEDEANAVSVAPGRTAEIIWRFSRPGTFLYACLIPGHWEAGMQGTVTVTAVAKPK